MLKKVFIILYFVMDVPVYADIPPSILGDNINVEVYTFIGAFLEKESASQGKSKKQVQKLYEQELRLIKSKELKPHIANIYEGEIPSLLRILVKSNPAYRDLTLYRKDGVGIATSGIENAPSFPNRLKSFKVGILLPEILSGPREYTYKDEQGALLKERIVSIYKDKERDFFYAGNKKKHPSDILIGYASYLRAE